MVTLYGDNVWPCLNADKRLQKSKFNRSSSFVTWTPNEEENAMPAEAGEVKNRLGQSGHGSFSIPSLK